MPPVTSVIVDRLIHANAEEAVVLILAIWLGGITYFMGKE